MRDVFYENSTYKVTSGVSEPVTPYSLLVKRLVDVEGYSWGDALSEAQRRKPELFTEHEALHMAVMTGDRSHVAGCRALVRWSFDEWQRQCEAFAEGEARGLRGSVLTDEERAYIDAHRGDAGNQYAKLVDVLHEAVMSEYPQMRRDVAYRLASELAAKREPGLASEEQKRLDIEVARLGGV